MLYSLPSHPNVVRLRQAVCSAASGRLYFVFEMLERNLLEVRLGGGTLGHGLVVAPWPLAGRVCRWGLKLLGGSEPR